MDTEFYKEFGELKGKVDGMSSQLVDLKQDVSKISDKIDLLGAVPYPVFDDHLKYADAHIKALTDRADANRDAIVKIFERLNLNDNSMTGKLSAFFNNAVVKIVGGGVILLVITVIAVTYMGEIQRMQQTMDDLRTDNTELKQDIKAQP